MLVGIDLGGSKIEGVVLNEQGECLCRQRVQTPRDNYPQLLDSVKQLIDELQQQTNFSDKTPIGFGTPGALNKNGVIKNSNSVCLNGQPLLKDLEEKLQRPIRIANDANCFALSEAIQGAGKDAHIVFGVIIGTGTGGGVVVNQQLVTGINAIGGEWGHNYMPGLGDITRGAAFNNEHRRCYCGRQNCIESYLCGEGLSTTYYTLIEQRATALEIAKLADEGDKQAQQALETYCHQLAYALSQVINIIDPDVVVLGGGLSNIPLLYQRVPELWRETIFSDTVDTRLLKAQHGDSSGVFGAAWLWK